MSGAFPDLPRRPLHPRPPGRGWTHAAWEVIGLLVVSGLAVGSLGWVVPGLVTDWRVRDRAVLIQGGRVENRHCPTRDAILMCEATLRAPGTDGDAVREVRHLIAFPDETRTALRVVGDPARPDWLTTDLGLDYFWNRVLTLAVTVVLFTALTVVGGRGALRARRRHAAWRRLPTVPVPLELVSVQALNNGARWTVRGETGATVQWVVPRRAKPFALGPGHILGLSGRDGAALFPLDAGLRWVALTRAERRVALAR